MLVKFGLRDLELGGRYLGDDLRDSIDLLDDPSALRSRMDDDGYLLLRGFHDRQAVLDARRTVLEAVKEQGSLKLDAELMEALVQPGSPYPRTMGRRVVTHQEPVRAVLESPRLFNFFSRFHGGKPVVTYDYKWLRVVRPPDNTGAHIDVVYMGRGSTSNLHTCWTPLGDIPMELGTLALCLGSHRLPGFAKVRETYGRMDVDRDNVGGWFSNDPVEIVEKFGGRWATTSFRAGDVLIFGMYTMHGSLNNVTDRYRISCDTRFQPADEPIDERWVGENPIAHYAWGKDQSKIVPMDEARRTWGI